MKLNNSKFIINNSTLLLISTLLLLSSCEQGTNPPSNNKITLTFEDASCTEAWLNLKTENILLPTKIIIKQDDSTVVETNINSNDTTLFVENLLPNQAYTFYSTIEQLNNETIKSNKLSISTMDTTSHNFTWQTFTFGGANGSSYLKDVAIINENNIWAVGEIHTAETDQWNADSTKWVQPYNAVHWDGNTWELKRILVDYRGQPNFAPLHGVFALPDGKIIFSSGLPYLPNGDSWKLYHLWDLGILDNDDGSVNSIWGTSIDNLYFVGTKGTIVHYNGSSWRKIESGTELRFLDINGKNDKIYCIAAELFSGINSEMYEIKNNRALLIDGTNIGTSSVTVYPIGKKLYVFGYYRLLQTEGKTGWEQISEPVNFDGYSKIRGNGYNDIVVAGSFGKIDHFNGVNWSQQRIKDKSNNLVDFSSIAIKGNTVCAVGRSGISIVTGRRN